MRNIITNKEALQESIDYIEEKTSQGYVLKTNKINPNNIYLSGGQQNISFNINEDGLDGEIRMSNPAGWTAYKSFSDELKGIESWYQGQKGSL